MKIIWQGTDSLYLVAFPKQVRRIKIFYVLGLRIFAKFMDVFAQEHYVCGELTESNIRRFGLKKPIKRFNDVVYYSEKFEKIPHTDFNIIYYYPMASDNAFNRWLYGYDIYLKLKEKWDIHLIDGKQDMSKIYPVTDLLIRPNRHDGQPRMIDECAVNDIPYIWTNTNPDAAYFNEKITEYEIRYKAQNKI